MSIDLTRQRALLREKYKSMLHGNTCDQLTALLLQFLLIPQGAKFTDYYNNLLKNSLESDPDCQPKKTSKALKYLEMYAINLYSSPWRHEFRNIKTYTGVYRLKVAACIKDAEGVLRLMGYVPKPGDAMALTLAESVDPDTILDIAFTLFMLQGECDIYRQVHARVKAHGHTMAQVHECRSTVGGGIEECVRWIGERYGRPEKPVDNQTPRNISVVDVSENYVPGRRMDDAPLRCYTPERFFWQGEGKQEPSRHRYDEAMLVRLDDCLTKDNVSAWIRNIPTVSECIPRHRISATDGDDIYSPMTAEQHRVRSYDVVRTVGTSVPVKAGVSVPNTVSLGMESMRNHTESACLLQQPFPMSLATHIQHSHPVSRSRDAANRRDDFGMRTHPDTLTTKRFSLYDNVDPADASESAPRKSSAGWCEAEKTPL